MRPSLTQTLLAGLAGVGLLMALASTAMAGEDTAKTSGAAQAPTTTPASTNAQSSVTEGPHRLESQIRLVVATNAPTASGTTNTEKAFHLQASWEGWDGLRLELSKRTRMPNVTGPFWQSLAGTNALAPIHLEQVKMLARLGGRLAVDGAGFVTSQGLTGFDGGVQLRRARITVGGDCILVLPVNYQVQVAYNAGQFSVAESYLVFEQLKWIGRLKLGDFQAPMGLALITSSRDISFMEPAAPLQAIAPGTVPGIQIGQPVFQGRATWTLGLFGAGSGSSEYGNASQNYGSVLARFTGLAIDHLDPEHPAENRYLHLGLSAEGLYSATSSIRYRSRPESYLAPYVIDTGDLAASSATTVAAEAAWVNGAFSAQGEYLQSFVREDGGEALSFGGFYAQASWYLTGESRPYSRRTGAFTRLIPRHDFSLSKGTWGALELACRYSYTDLTDGNIQGGRLNLLMGGVNWYLQSHLKWMFNYGLGHVAGGAETGTMNIFQTRVEVDF